MFPMNQVNSSAATFSLNSERFPSCNLDFETWELTPITANPVLSDEMAGTDLRGRALVLYIFRANKLL